MSLPLNWKESVICGDALGQLEAVELRNEGEICARKIIVGMLIGEASLVIAKKLNLFDVPGEREELKAVLTEMLDEAFHVFDTLAVSLSKQHELWQHQDKIKLSSDQFTITLERNGPSTGESTSGPSNSTTVSNE